MTKVTVDGGMKQSLVSWALAASMFVMASSAQAQLSTGASGFSSAPTEASEKEYWWLVRELGRCLAQNKTDQSIDFLAASNGSSQEDRAFGKLFNRTRNMCMRNFVRASFVRAHVRGTVAEGLFNRNLSQHADDYVPVVSAPDKIVSIHDFATCYVASNYVQARTFLSETRLATEGELEYVQRLAPSFKPCLPVGREVELIAMDIRLALAEALYRATSMSVAQAEKEDS